MGQLMAAMFAASAGGLILVELIVGIAVYILVALGTYGTYQKAGSYGQPAWAAFVPFYNFIVLLRVAGRPKNWGWFLLLLILSLVIPVVGFIPFFVVYVIVAHDVSKSFGHGGWFTFGLVFPLLPVVPIIFWYILWLGPSTYRGPAGPAGSSGTFGNTGTFGSPYPGGYPPPGQAPPPPPPASYPPPGQPTPPPGQMPPPVDPGPMPPST
jgi:hypothetical protein